ncbi:MAG: GDYXXLXY domain-containing protein [Marinifilum sp.]|jgi:uncharacterized membrane-anchored protein|nr:GDYXXLXY domain-containing protein [Marinifilum sp.]
MYKNFIFPIFILIALIQLAIPVKSIYDQEQILTHGKEFKFQTVPVDPTDPFRGKYIALNFKENTIGVSTYEKWNKGEKVFVIVEEDKNGFAQVMYASKTVPNNHNHYLSAIVQRVTSTKGESNLEIQIQYPFDRYYMEESKAKAAENLYRKATADQKILTYALVNIKDGKTTLKDVMIDGKSIKDLIVKSQKD